jgi:hypothetical protein
MDLPSSAAYPGAVCRTRTHGGVGQGLHMTRPALRRTAIAWPLFRLHVASAVFVQTLSVLWPLAWSDCGCLTVTTWKPFTHAPTGGAVGSLSNRPSHRLPLR